MSCFLFVLFFFVFLFTVSVLVRFCFVLCIVKVSLSVFFLRYQFKDQSNVSDTFFPLFSFDFLIGVSESHEQTFIFSSDSSS